MNLQYHWLSGTCHHNVNDFMIGNKVHSLFIWTYFTFESTSSFKSDFAATRNIGTFPLCSFSSGIQRSRTFIKEYWWSYEHNSRIISVNKKKVNIFQFRQNLGPKRRFMAHESWVPEENKKGTHRHLCTRGFV